MTKLDTEFVVRNGKIQKPETFLALCFLTFGLYSIWWNYRVWRFFKERDGLDILPAARAIFEIFFIYSLLSKINSEAVKKGAPQITHGFYATLFIVTSFLASVVGRLFPDSLAALFFVYYIFLIPSLKQLNFYWESEAPEIVTRSMSSGAIVAVVIGSICWVLLLTEFISEQF